MNKWVFSIEKLKKLIYKTFIEVVAYKSLFIDSINNLSFNY